MSRKEKGFSGLRKTFSGATPTRGSGSHGTLEAKRAFNPYATQHPGARVVTSGIDTILTVIKENPLPSG